MGTRTTLTLAALAITLLCGCKETHKRLTPPKRTAPARRQIPTPTRTPPLDPGPSGPAPHPDYPTPAAAGTEKIFYLEEPDRGPKVTPVTLPARRTLQWRTSAYCEPHETGIACAATAGPAWRIGSSAGRVVVAQRMGGARVRETYLYERDRAGRLVRISELDGRGLVTTARFFDRSEPWFSARNRDGSNALAGCGHMRYKLGAGGHPAELACLQWTGKPMRGTDGVRVRRFRRDRQGFPLEVAFFTETGEPMVDNDGVHRVRYKLDKRGREVEARFLDPEGNPLAWNGCHGRRQTHDARGLLRRTCVDAEGRPAPGLTGAPVEDYRRDGNGCITRKRFLDGAGVSMTNRIGVAELRFTVNRLCQDLSQACFDQEGRPVACGPGQPARRVYRYDHRGFLVSTKSYTAAGEPGHDATYRVFEVQSGRDDLGNAISTSCFDASGHPVECSGTGFHRTTSKTDDAGRMVEQRFFDANGAPTTNLGCSIRRFRYDNYDHEVEASDHDAQGNVIEVQSKAYVRTLFDQSHRRFALLLFDKQNKPSRYTACFVGVDCPSQVWHAVRIVRDSKGGLEKNQYFDAAGQLVETLDCHRQRCWE